MPNMHYCRFQNTSSDLYECYKALNNGELGDLDGDEKEAARDLIGLCRRVANEHGDLDD